MLWRFEQTPIIPTLIITGWRLPPSLESLASLAISVKLMPKPPRRVRVDKLPFPFFPPDFCVRLHLGHLCG